MLDINDRNLRYVVTGLGAKTNGVTMESGFDITPASEIMAILCLATDINDLKERLANIVVATVMTVHQFMYVILKLKVRLPLFLKMPSNLIWYRQFMEHQPWYTVSICQYRPWM